MDDVMPRLGIARRLDLTLWFLGEGGVWGRLGVDGHGNTSIDRCYTGDRYCCWRRGSDGEGGKTARSLGLAHCGAF